MQQFLTQDKLGQPLSVEFTTIDPLSPQFSERLNSLSDSLISDREALNSIDRFRISPKEYRQNIEAITSHLNTRDGHLVKSVRDLEKVFFDVKKFAGSLYEPKYRLE